MQQVGLDIEEALRGDHRFSWSKDMPVELVIKQGHSAVHHPTLPIYDDERGVDRSMICQMNFLAMADCYRDCGYFKPIPRTGDSKDPLVEFTRNLCRALDKQGLENVRAFFNKWSPTILTGHDMIRKLQTAAEKEDHKILKDVMLHMATAFTLREDKDAKHSVVQYVLKVTLAWEWSNLRSRLYNAYKDGTDSRLLAKLPIGVADQNKFTSDDKVLRKAIFNYMAECCGLRGSEFERCIVKSKNWNTAATSMCAVIEILGWSVAMMLPPASFRM